MHRRSGQWIVQDYPACNLGWPGHPLHAFPLLPLGTEGLHASQTRDVRNPSDRQRRYKALQASPCTAKMACSSE
eukprot:6433837-Amphidinium_carterae.1